MITRKEIETLPNTIGIYLFKKDKTINYIGKSVNIKARLLSHLENSKLDNKERSMIINSNKIETIVTESEFKALILEAKLIREFQPKYNSIWKDDKSPLYIKVTIKNEFPKILITRKPASVKATADEESLYFGPFSSVRMVEKIINDIRRIIPFCTQKNISSKACFYSKIGLCNPCPNEIKNINEKKQYRKNINQAVSILNGNVKKIISSFNKELNSLIKNDQYEKAIIVRNKIFRFDRLKEVMSRRIKQNWPVPDLLIIDGGRPQIKAMLKIFHNNGLNIPLIGIAKNPDRVIIGIEGYPNLFLKNDSNVLNVIRLLRDESHRFARKYHLFLRSKDFLI